MMDTVRVNLLSPESNVVTPPPTADARRQGVVVAMVLLAMLGGTGWRWYSERGAAAPVEAPKMAKAAAPVAGEKKTFLVDPVCKGLVDPGNALFVVKIGGTKVYFDHEECVKAFQADPVAYATRKNLSYKVNPSATPRKAEPVPETVPEEPVVPEASLATPSQEAVIPPAAEVPVTEPAPPVAVPSQAQPGWQEVPVAPAQVPQAAPGAKIPTFPSVTIDQQPTPEADAPSVEEDMAK